MKNRLFPVLKLLENEIKTAQDCGDIEVFNRLCEAANVLIYGTACGIPEGRPMKRKSEIKPDMSALERFKHRYGNEQAHTGE